MKKTKPLEERIPLPLGVTVVFEKGELIARGPRGEVKRSYLVHGVTLQKNENTVTCSIPHCDKRHKRTFYTFVAHLRNMIRGVAEGFSYKLKICSGHFPMNVKIDKHEIMISNFLGEKIPRRATVLDTVKVTMAGEVLIVEGNDLEKTGQTAANIEIATKIKNRDRRVFQDGIYIIEKPSNRRP